jgi:exopolysaccharide biosynthesis protein
MSAKEVTLFLQKHFDPQYAINMDGGGSTAMSIKGKLMNDQDTNNNGNGERAVPTHILVFDSKQ